MTKPLVIDGLLDCQACPLAKSRKQVVPGETGSRYNGVVLIGEAPGRDEDQQGRPFVGPAGKILQGLLEQAGLDTESFHYTNAVKCWPHVEHKNGSHTFTKTVAPKPTERRTCVSKWLWSELDSLDPPPHTIITVGAEALKALSSKATISTWHRRAVQVDIPAGMTLRSVKLVPMYHPSRIQHDPSSKPEVEADFMALPGLLAQEPEKEDENGPEYTWVESDADVRDAFAILEGQGIALDTETVEPGYPSHASHAILLGLSASSEAGRAFYIDAWHPAFDGIVSRVKEILRDPRRIKFLWNAAFDLEVLGVYDAVNYHDGMLMAYVLQKPWNGLKENAQTTLGVYNAPTLIALKAQYKVKTVQELPDDVRAKYGAADADYTRQLCLRYLKALKAQPRLLGVYTTIELPVVPVVMEMTRVGFGIRPDVLKGLLTEIEPRMEQARIACEAAVGSTAIEWLKTQSKSAAEGGFNPRSTDHLRRILFDYLQLPVVHLTDTGQPSTDAEAIASLSESHPQLGLWEPLLEYRELDKIRGTYCEGILKRLCGDCPTPTLHTELRQTGADTGRMSSADPNLQTLPIKRSLGRRVKDALEARSR